MAIWRVGSIQVSLTPNTMIALRFSGKIILISLFFSTLSLPTLSLQGSYATPMHNLLSHGDFENTQLERQNFSPRDQNSFNQWLARRNWKVIRNSTESSQSFVQHQAGSALLFQGISAEELRPGTTLSLSFDAIFAANQSWSTVSVYGLTESGYINQQGLQFSRTGDTLLYDKYTESHLRKSWQHHTYQFTVNREYKALVVVFHTAGQGSEQRRGVDNVVLIVNSENAMSSDSFMSVLQKFVHQLNLG